MKVFTLNCGSSSVKYAVVDVPLGKVLCHGIVNRVTSGESFIEHFDDTNKKSIQPHEGSSYTTAINSVLTFLTSLDIIRDVSEIVAVGHRVVHGGEQFTQPVIIDDSVINKIEEFAELAPSHNPANLAGIKVAMKLLPHVPNVAIFDTAFFTTMPPYVYIYGLPYEWFQKYHIRKYGFHGTSHYYVFNRAAELLRLEPHEINAITLHIGNGVSITAVKRGVAFDHSMGFTPLEGAVMGTRCGDIDPAIPLWVMKKEKLGCEDMENILNTKSGLLGISGKYMDRREILMAMNTGDERAKLSFEIECYRLRKYIGAYAAGMGRVDALVFTGGVGENSFLHRLKTCEGLEFMGINIDCEANKEAIGGEKEVCISTPDSSVKVFVIPTNEEIVFAKQVFQILNSGHDNL